MKCSILFVLSHAFVGYKKKLKFCKNNQSQDVISSHSTRHCKGHNEIIMTFSATWMGIIPFVRRATEMTRLYLQTWCCFYINANFWVMKYIHGIFHYHWYKILLYFIKLLFIYFNLCPCPPHLPLHHLTEERTTKSRFPPIKMATKRVGSVLGTMEMGRNKCVEAVPSQMIKSYIRKVFKLQAAACTKKV